MSEHKLKIEPWDVDQPPTTWMGSYEAEACEFQSDRRDTREEVQQAFDAYRGQNA